MSGRNPMLRSLAGGAGASALLVGLGGRGITGADYARQAGAGAVAVATSDWYNRTYGDGSMVSNALQTAVGGASFALINRFALGSADPLGTLFVGGCVIDVVASFLENPLGNALGL